MKKLIAGLFILPFLFACSTSVKRVETNLVKDVSGSWNDTDSQQVAQDMITDCLKGGWYAEYMRTHTKKPVVIAGTVDNKTMEHINTGTFVEEMQRALINSGKVGFVASKDERDEIRQERMEQEDYASTETRKSFGQEIGADFILKGVLQSIIDKEGSRAVVYYQTNLKLIDLENNQVVWNGQNKTKKYVKRSKVSL